MMSKPPPIPPPPIQPLNRESDAVNRLYWMVAPAVLLGVLFAIFFLSWFVNSSDVGQGNDATVVGNSQSLAASLDQDNGNAKSHETQSNSHGPESPNTDETTSDIPGVQVTNERKVIQSPSEDASEQEVEINHETTLRIFEQKRTAQRSQLGAKAPNLEDRGGANPFVGTGKPAKSTVYVIDVSGSMQTADRLPRVLSALERAVDLLNPEQKFTVILFDDSAHTDPIGKGLLLAKKTNKQAIYDWLERAPGGGGTNPLPAMIMAIQQKPEKIVLLSDGEFDPTSSFIITQANQSNAVPSRIDCVGLMEEVETLKEIARLNKGIYYQAQ